MATVQHIAQCRHSTRSLKGSVTVQWLYTCPRSSISHAVQTKQPWVSQHWGIKSSCKSCTHNACNKFISKHFRLAHWPTAWIKCSVEKTDNEKDQCGLWQWNTNKNAGKLFWQLPSRTATSFVGHVATAAGWEQNMTADKAHAFCNDRKLPRASDTHALAWCLCYSRQSSWCQRKQHSKQLDVSPKQNYTQLAHAIAHNFHYAQHQPLPYIWPYRETNAGLKIPVPVGCGVLKI